MRENALYFPYIRVPNNNWFTHVLLYWDRVGSIVPTDYVKYPERLGRYMQELLTAELLDQVHPAYHLHRIDKFEDNFVKFIDTQAKAREKKKIKSYGPSDKSPLIHIEKLGNIADELEDRNLAFNTGEYGWYHVVDWVADPFMAYLACCLGQLEDVNSAPVTQDQLTTTIIGGSHKSFLSKITLRYLKTRESILDKILPIPEKQPTINDLVDFKSRHGNLLKSFRNKIEEKCIDISNIKGKVLRQNRLELSIKSLQDEISEIEEVMRSRWKNVIFQSLFPFFAAGASLGISDFGKLFSWGGATIGFAGAIYGAFSAEKDYENKMKAPLAYAAFMRKRMKG